MNEIKFRKVYDLNVCDLRGWTGRKINIKKLAN